MSDNLTFDRQARVTFAVSPETRTIKGLAVPFGDVGNNGFGSYRFAKGTLDWSKVKYLDQHSWSKACGTVTFAETDEGLEMTAKIAPGALGDQILALTTPDPDTGEAVYDGLSIGLSSDARFEQDDDGVYNCLSATVLEVSGTPIPAFSNAQVRSVAASAAQNKEKDMNDKIETPPAFSQADGTALMEQVTTLSKKIADLEDIKIPVGPGTAQFQIAEEPIYRFGGTENAPSGFDFATDLLAAGRDGDAKAMERVQKFTAERLAPTSTTFADQPTTTADTAAINPSQYRPDMFLGQAPAPRSPLYDFFYKGGLSNVTPFFWSKLDRANTDIGVADHTEGTNPETRDLVTAAGATVTPTPVSGRVHITREVADQGGNPQVSGLVWSEFDRSLKIALETKTAALLAAAAAGVTSLTAAIAAGANGLVAGQAVENGLVDVQFLADGYRFEKMFGHVDLYKALTVYENADGEKRYPIINPQNRSGIAGDKYSFLDIAGYRMNPAASLGATSANASLSWLADPNAVHVWNSGLQRLDRLGETVEGWDLGVFAYFAGVVYDPTGLRKISYDPVP